MSEENYNAVPTPFRGLRVLLVDNDTSTLLNIAKGLEKFSYRVTTTELATVALSILQERKDCFDLIMADTNMPEMDIFKFINNVQLIKDFPIILMSTELNKDMVKEAMIKGACFFLEKPISSKNLKNVWQQVCRQSKSITGKKAANKSNSDQEADSKGAEIENDDKALEIVDERPFQESESEHVGDSDQIENDQDDNSTRICMKRPIMTENDEQGNSKKRKSLAGNERETKKENGILEKQSHLQV
ncbi:two-component response regulator arr11 [Phtheirospermum japonicum]|uniref:Two-component response regulator arr11 n=1 Tax=Phtheirospermum japonicum TaxID=374723 RepID=A0A830CVK0_9LAMI|nr:two-component response regulator arr11 [Phtheirospermum japonicum]